MSSEEVPRPQIFGVIFTKKFVKMIPTLKAGRTIHETYTLVMVTGLLTKGGYSRRKKWKNKIGFN